MDRFLTPARTQQFDITIKRSRFITRVGSVASKDAARLFIEQCRCDMPDASHHCWAMATGAPTTSGRRIRAMTVNPEAQPASRY